MSAPASSTSVYQASTKRTEHNLELAGSPANISVTARIDYSLRFTKQAILVVGELSEQYSPLASQYLVSLSKAEPAVDHLIAADKQINVAFVAASTKLNDIQIRCRLIEQLFFNTLFDPEQSLAVSIVRFAKQHGEAITIVVDHAHALSLQVKYELCQLVHLAQKNKLIINVVLFGLTEAAQQLAVNKTLFKNKMTIIEAQSGQILSLEDKRITLTKNVSTLALWQKVSLATALGLTSAVAIWLYLLIAADVNKQTFNSADAMVLVASDKDNTRAESLTAPLAGKEIRPMKKKQKTLLLEKPVSSHPPLGSALATVDDITKALFGSPIVYSDKKTPAETDDILQALSITGMGSKPQLSKQGMPFAAIAVLKVNANYYQIKAKEYQQGYIVQIAGFTNKVTAQRFISQHPQQTLYSYQRLLADKSFTVVTSKVYRNKAVAKAAMALLPAKFKKRKPWLKSNSSVISEINTFTR